ncbi:MAG: ATP-binding protein [Parasphingorhabdus sp.]|jgi:signal transduction histidine kinase/methylmalonyl-CoA mutase cobalamin-binding subunit|uniref:ATP-binding protein n=1 Tax=Alphaproteobacteria TaxID=28211 RepID=UPI003265963A
MPVRVEDIAVAVRPVPTAVTVSAVFTRLLADPDQFAVPIVSDGAALGMVTRRAVIEALATPSGRQSNGAARITDLMRDQPVMCEAGTPVGLVAKLAADGSTAALTDGVIVLSEGKYLGLISPSALLSAVALENAARARAMQVAQKRLQKTKNDAGAFDQEKARFLAFVGHEIRTPLTGILGVADLLQDSVNGGEPKRLARTISESGHHLDRLLTDLLDLSRLEAGKLAVNNAPFDLHEFANDARDLWQSRIAGKRLDLRIKVAGGAVARLEADAMRIRQILFNLMSNALKFTERGYIGVELSTLEAAGNLKLRMTVEDTGCGITDLDKTRLFQAFEQARPSTAGTHGGFGLGLSIAKGLARRLGGEITLADNPEGGSIFTVTMPVERAGPRLAVAGAPPKPRMRAFELGRILLAEDHAVSALVVTRALSAAGWQVDTVQTAEDAIDRAATHPYQAILTDIHLPGASGDEVLTAIRAARGPNALAPIIAVTADVSPERRLACEQAGFTTIIEKPIRPRALVASLVDILLADREAAAEAGHRQTA